ncbi:hypothetical protein ACHAXA_001965 [Cyclostephanos tholiformis]|uniref:Alanyl-transfer RNA synthetases family profile domain-containing protein n=1 Tax=Cyclostephanos tholiformis TaxID=382380 RepID=A0ABD3RU96_9STRA
MAATELVHLTHEGNFQLDTEAKVVSCRVVRIEETREIEGGNTPPSDDDDDDVATLSVEIILDVTTMHPRGGGQPSDVGTISILGHAHHLLASISDVIIDKSTGVVVHRGIISIPRKDVPSFALVNDDEDSPSSSFVLPGSTVVVRVNEERRRLNSECHTAGHVVDAAMSRIDDGCFVPVKGYHFMDGPYVEYCSGAVGGGIDAKERDAFLVRLKEAFQELIDDDVPTVIRTLPAEEAKSLCGDRLARNFDASDRADAPVRVVTVAGWHSPCGGTHVRSTGELKGRGWSVRGLRCKKGAVRVRYGPAEES